MFSRLEHTIQIFALVVMDLTAGYHQAPVGLGPVYFAAFICFAEYSSSVITV
jgi:hypothetical protein